jgi:hypothetical protein
METATKLFWFRQKLADGVCHTVLRLQHNLQPSKDLFGTQKFIRANPGQIKLFPPRPSFSSFSFWLVTHHSRLSHRIKVNPTESKWIKAIKGRLGYTSQSHPSLVATRSKPTQSYD